jgi:hypothetical protein
MKTFIKIILLFALLLISFSPLLMASVYMVTGLDKTAFISSLQSIPEHRFWFTGIPLFIVCMYTTVFLLWKLIHLDTTPRKPVDNITYYPALCVEDPNLGSKLRSMLETQY